MNIFLAILILLASLPPAPPVVSCHWPQRLGTPPAVEVVRHAPAHTTLTWQPAPGATGVAVIAVSPREARGLLDTTEVPGVVTVEDRAQAAGYWVYERRSGTAGCVAVPLIGWNFWFVGLVVAG